MKELITTQLIEEYQKRIVLLNKFIDDSGETTFDRALSIAKRNELRSVITSLQSKQSEERQNIVDGYVAGKYEDKFDTSEDYFNQTFKQEQK